MWLVCGCPHGRCVVGRGLPHPVVSVSRGFLSGGWVWCGGGGGDLLGEGVGVVVVVAGGVQLRCLVRLVVVVPAVAVVFWGRWCVGRVVASVCWGR